MWKTILDLFFPINCLGCGQEAPHHFSKKSGGGFICPSCFKKIPLNKKLPLKFQDSALIGLVIASDYAYSLVKQTIHRYKYDFIKDLAEPLGKLMIKKLASCSGISKKDIFLLPVPLHKKRLRWRGFNQAELLAQVISQELGIPLINDLLIRTKYSLPQVNIKSSQERKENIKQAFQLSPQPSLNIRNKTIILVDDVCTTGATLEECAKALKPLKPKEIWGLVVARG